MNVSGSYEFRCTAAREVKRLAMLRCANIRCRNAGLLRCCNKVDFAFAPPS